MPDNSVECGAIIARLTAIEAAQRQHLNYVSQKIAAMERTLEEIRLQRAEERGESKALARVGAIVVAGVSLVGATFMWLTTGGGAAYIKKMLV